MDKQTYNPRSPASPLQSEPVSLVLTALRRWGLLATTTGIVLAGIGATIVIWLWEPVYDAKKFVLILQNQGFRELDGAESTKIEPSSVLAAVQAEPILRRVSRDSERLLVGDTEPDRIKELSKMVRWENAGGDRYAIVCRHVNPNTAAKIVNSVTDKFFKDYKDLRSESNEQLKENVRPAIQKAEAEIVLINQKLTQLQKDLLFFPGQDETMVTDPDGIYLSQLRKVNFAETVKRDELVIQISRLKAALAEGGSQIDDETILQQVGEHPQVRNILQQLALLENQKADKAGLGPNHDEIRAIDRRIKQKNAELAERKESLKSVVADDLAKQWNLSTRGTLAAKEEELQGIEVRLQLNEQEISRLKANLVDTSNKASEIEQLRDEKKEKYAELNRWKDQEAELQKRDFSLLNLIIEGDVAAAGETESASSATQVEVYPIKLLAIVVLGTFCLPYGLAVAWEFRRRRVSNPEQISLQGKVTVLGEVAHLPLGGRVGRQRSHQQLRLYEESVDNLTAILAHSTASSNVISITSAASNEGKTTLASQLAISIARSGYGRILLIDTDLRSPSLHRLFELPLDPGLAGVLGGVEELSETVIETAIENLDVLAAGRIRSNPRRYFSDDRWAELLELAKGEYAHIIVDTPPVLAASEALPICKACETTLLCVLRDVSRIDSVRQAHERLMSAGVSVGGCVFGGVPQSRYAYKYGSYGYNLT